MSRFGMEEYTTFFLKTETQFSLDCYDATCSFVRATNSQGKGEV